MAPADRALAVRELPELSAQLQALLVARAAAHRGQAGAPPDAKLEARVAFLMDQWRAVVTAVHDAGGGLWYSPWETKGDKATLLHTAVDDIVNGAYTTHLKHFRAPTSMRDVEPAVHIWVDRPRDLGVK